jgi:hypothetical protein
LIIIRAVVNPMRLCSGVERKHGRVPVRNDCSFCALRPHVANCAFRLLIELSSSSTGGRRDEHDDVVGLELKGPRRTQRSANRALSAPLGLHLSEVLVRTCAIDAAHGGGAHVERPVAQGSGPVIFRAPTEKREPLR